MKFNPTPRAFGAILVALGLWSTPARSQSLTNGGNHDGTILANQSNVWAFVAAAGDRLVLRDGRLTGAGFNPWMRLFAPGGALIGDAGSVNNDIAHEIAVTATNSGTFTVVVADSTYGGANDTGTYRLFFARMPGTFVVADDGGALTNGANHDAEITVGDLDPWVFTASAGDRVVLRTGRRSGATFSPWMRLYGPAGPLLLDSGANNAQAAQELALTVTNTGVFTVIITDSNAGNPDDTGTYRLHFFKFPGTPVAADDSGALRNGADHLTAITIGDLDGWSFAANAGESVILRISRQAGDTSFNPWLRLYGPGGELISDGISSSAQLVQDLAFTVTNSGSYVALVGDGSSGNFDDAGGYKLCFVKVPGVPLPPDDGGRLTNAVSARGSSTLGDLDAWQFLACRGETVTLRLGRLTNTNAFDPLVRLYGPTGALLASRTGGQSVFLPVVPAQSGLFTMVVGDGASGGFEGAGDYEITAEGIANDARQLCRPILAGANLDLAGLGGTPGARFVIYSSTNAALPLSLWTAIYTNQYDGLGLFQKSDFALTGDQERYFMLRED